MVRRMGQIVKINKNINGLSYNWVLKEVYSQLNKTGIQMYTYFITLPSDTQEIEITQKALDKVNISRKQYQRGMENLREEHYIVDDITHDKCIFYYKPITKMF